jgi:hypothetical protein
VEFSIGDFAEQLMAQEQSSGKGFNNAPPTLNPTHSAYSPDVTQQVPDVSNIEVPVDFVASIAEGKAPEVVQESAPEVSEPQPLTEVAELKSLVSELKELVSEMKQTISEVTSAGSLGVNMAGAQSKDTKKDDEEDNVKKILKRIKAKRS